MIDYANGTFEAIAESAHNIDELFVHNIGQDLWEVVCPHRYHARQATGEHMTIEFTGRMKIQTNLSTTRDPGGEQPKVIAYKVVAQSEPGASEQGQIDAAKSGIFTVGEAKAFVHRWFQHIDLGDAETLVNMTSAGPLSIDIMGNQVDNSADLGAFLKAQGDAQAWSAHTPHAVTASPTADGFAVRFVLHFQGEVSGVGYMTLSNVTRWTLVEEDGALRLRDYTLEVL